MEISHQVDYFQGSSRKRRDLNQETIRPAKVQCCVDHYSFSSNVSLTHTSDKLISPSPQNDQYISQEVMMEYSSPVFITRTCPQCLAGQGGHLTHIMRQS